jgi:hypothetical protein
MQEYRSELLASDIAAAQLHENILVLFTTYIHSYILSYTPSLNVRKKFEH